jgi:hypothetical protein
MSVLQHGVDIAVIALWLGHEAIETIQTYLHADPAMKKKPWLEPPNLPILRLHPHFIGQTIGCSPTWRASELFRVGNQRILQFSRKPDSAEKPPSPVHCLFFFAFLRGRLARRRSRRRRRDCPRTPAEFEQKISRSSSFRRFNPAMPPRPGTLST